MVRKSFGTSVALLAAAVILATASSAHAGLHGLGYRGWGGYGSLGGYSVGAWAGPYSGWASSGSLGYLGVGYGSSGYGSLGYSGLGGHIYRKHLHHAARRAWVHGGLAYASTGSYGGGWGYHGYGYGYGSYGGYASYGGSLGYASTGYSFASCGSSGGVYSGYASTGGGSVGGWSGYSAASDVIEAPSTQPPPPAGGSDMGPPGAPPPPPESAPEVPGDSASMGGAATLLTVQVPEDAQLYVNGHRTRSTGPVRLFRSTALRAGRDYPYELRAVVQRDGRMLTETKTIRLSGGTQQQVRFQLDTAPRVDTRVTLTVPEDARVELGGVATTSTGAERTFSTTKLDQGERWENYTIKVSLDRSGRTITQERVMDLVGGESYDVTFDFDPDMKVASAR